MILYLLNLFILKIIIIGHHRNLGASITKVRSTKLDSWTNQMIEIMINIGNNVKKINIILFKI